MCPTFTQLLGAAHMTMVRLSKLLTEVGTGQSWEIFLIWSFGFWVSWNNTSKDLFYLTFSGSHHAYFLSVLGLFSHFLIWFIWNLFFKRLWLESIFIFIQILKFLSKTTWLFGYTHFTKTRKTVIYPILVMYFLEYLMYD